MSSDEKKAGPLAEGPADTTTAASSIDDGADEEQLTLWAYAIPAHRPHPAEAHMRRFVNTVPRKRRVA